MSSKTITRQNSLADQLTRLQKTAIYNWLKQDITWIDLFCHIQPLLPDSQTKVRLLHVSELLQESVEPKEYTLREAAAIGGTFLSHKWFPTSERENRAFIKSYIVQNLIGHVWVDHLCCATTDPIKDVICAIALLTFFKFDAYFGPSEESYMESMWCLTELIVSQPDRIEQDGPFKGTEAQRIIERSTQIYNIQVERDRNLKHENQSYDAPKPFKMEFSDNAYLIALCLIFCFEGNLTRFIISMRKKLSPRRADAFLTTLIFHIRRDLGFENVVWTPPTPRQVNPFLSNQMKTRLVNFLSSSTKKPKEKTVTIVESNGEQPPPRAHFLNSTRKMLSDRAEYAVTSRVSHAEGEREYRPRRRKLRNREPGQNLMFAEASSEVRTVVDNSDNSDNSDDEPIQEAVDFSTFKRESAQNEPSIRLLEAQSNDQERMKPMEGFDWRYVNPSLILGMLIAIALVIYMLVKMLFFLLG